MAPIGFRHHLGLKFLSLALAALLWLVVSGEQVAERVLRVPLEFTNLPSALERATEANELWPASGSALLDPIYDPVRSSARFQALLRRVNLPVDVAINGPRPISR